jgi:Mn2+/Fe2+ NRAMP family transporter
VLYLIVRIASNRKVMGRWTNSRLSTGIGWLTVISMSVAGIMAVYALFTS